MDVTFILLVSTLTKLLLCFNIGTCTFCWFLLALDVLVLRCGSTNCCFLLALDVLVLRCGNFLFCISWYGNYVWKYYLICLLSVYCCNVFGFLSFIPYIIAFIHTMHYVLSFIQCIIAFIQLNLGLHYIQKCITSSSH